MVDFDQLAGELELPETEIGVPKPKESVAQYKDIGHPFGAAKSAVFDVFASPGVALFEKPGKGWRGFWENAKKNDPDINAWAKAVEDKTEPFLGKWIGSLGHTASGLAMRYIPYVGPLLTMSLYSNLQQEEIESKALELGADENTAKAVSWTAGPIVASLDFLGTEFIFRTVRGKALANLLTAIGTASGVSHAIAGTATTLLKTGAVEGGQEGMQGVMSYLAEQWAARPPDETAGAFSQRMTDEKHSKEMWEIAKHDTALGALSGVFFGGMGLTTETMAARAKAKAAPTEVPTTISEAPIAPSPEEGAPEEPLPTATTVPSGSFETRFGRYLAGEKREIARVQAEIDTNETLKSDPDYQARQKRIADLWRNLRFEQMSWDSAISNGREPSDRLASMIARHTEELTGLSEEQKKVYDAFKERMTKDVEAGIDKAESPKVIEGQPINPEDKYVVKPSQEESWLDNAIRRVGGVPGVEEGAAIRAKNVPETSDREYMGARGEEIAVEKPARVEEGPLKVTLPGGKGWIEGEITPDKFYLHDVYVEKGERGAGFGLKAVRDTVDAYPDKEIWVASTSKGMDKIAEKLGFEKVAGKGRKPEGIPEQVSQNNATVWKKAPGAVKFGFGKELDLRAQHFRYRAIADMIHTSGGSSAIPVIIENAQQFTPAEQERLTKFFENASIDRQGMTVETVAKATQIPSLINYEKKQVGVKGAEIKWKRQQDLIVGDRVQGRYKIGPNEYHTGTISRRIINKTSPDIATRIRYEVVWDTGKTETVGCNAVDQLGRPSFLDEKRAKIVEGKAKFGLSPEEQRRLPSIKPEGRINGITRAEAGKMLANGDDTVLEHIKQGVKEHGPLVMQDAIQNEILRTVKDSKGTESQQQVIENLRRMEPLVREIVKTPPEQTGVATAIKTSFQKIAQVFKNAPIATVITDASQIPEEHRALMDKENPDWQERNPKGVFLETRQGPIVYIFANNMTSVGEAQLWYLHEIVGHYGLHGAFGNALNSILDRVWMSFGKSKAMGDIVERYFKGEFDNNNAEHRRTASEEFIADLATRFDLTQKEKTLLDRVRQFLREVLSKFGFDVKMTEGDLDSILAKSLEYVKGGEAQGKVRGNVRFAQGKEPVPFTYSVLQKAVNFPDMPSKVQSIPNYLARKGVTREEIAWTGLNQWLEDNKQGDKIDREQLRAYVAIATEETEMGEVELLGKDLASQEDRINAIRKVVGRLSPEEATIFWENFDEVDLSPDNQVRLKQAKTDEERITIASKASWESLREIFGNTFQLENDATKEWARYEGYFSEAHNYRELVIHLPNMGRRKDYHSPHWGGDYAEGETINDVAFHVLIDESKGEGPRELNVLELQGDWPQDLGKKQGTPDFPFAHNWVKLGIQKVIRYAAEKGYDKVTFPHPDELIKHWGSDRYAWKKIPAVSLEDFNERTNLGKYKRGEVESYLKELGIEIKETEMPSKAIVPPMNKGTKIRVAKILLANSTKDLNDLIDNYNLKMQTANTLKRMLTLKSEYATADEIVKIMQEWESLNVRGIQNIIQDLYNGYEGPPSKLTGHFSRLADNLMAATGAKWEVGKPVYNLIDQGQVILENDSYEQAIKNAIEYARDEKVGKKAWQLSYTTQVGGYARGFDLQQEADRLAREGKFQQYDTTEVSTKQDVEDLMRRMRIVKSHHTDAYVARKVDQLWNKMQKSPESGALLPRKEGMEFSYGEKIPGALEKFAKQFGATVERESSKPKIEFQETDNSIEVIVDGKVDDVFRWGRNSMRGNETKEDALEEARRYVKTLEDEVKRKFSITINNKMRETAIFQGFARFAFGKVPDTISTYIGKHQTTMGEAVSKAWDSVKSKEFRAYIRRKVFDRLDPVKQMIGLESYKVLSLQNGAPVVFDTLLTDGKLKWDGKVLTCDTRGQGFIPWLEAMGKDANKFLYWTMARRAEALETQTIRKRDPNTGQMVVVPKERWLTETVRNEIYKWAGDKDKSEWVAKAKELDEWNKNTLDIAEKAGLINHDARVSWEQDFYIPFYRIMENAIAKNKFMLSPNKSRRFISAQIRRLEGAEMKVGDPLENMLKNWNHLITASIENVARETCFEEAKAKGMGLVEEVGFKDLHVFKRGTGSNSRMVYVTKRDQKNVLVFQRDGKPIYFKVDSEPLFEALGGVEFNALNGVAAKFFSTPKRLLTYSATFGPAFKVNNMIRDAIHTSLIDKDFGRPPSSLLEPLFPLFALRDALKGFRKAWNNDPNMVRLKAAGGAFGTSYIHSQDMEIVTKRIEKILRKEKGAIVLSTFRKALDWWEKVGTASENAVRVQGFANKTKNGMSTLDAAFAVRDYLDFSRHGSSKAVQLLIHIIPFLNARTQGNYKLFNTATQAETMVNFGVRGTLLTLASLMLWGAFKDDDRYKELEEWDRMAYYHWWIGDTHVRMPKPFEIGVFFSSIPEAIANVICGNDEGKHIWNVMWKGIRDVFAMDLPQTIKPIYEQWANKTFFTGRPIVGAHLEGLIPGEQHDPWTSETLQGIGKQLGMSPNRIKALIDGYFSTIGIAIIGGTDVLTRTFFDFPARPTMKIDDYPLIGTFLKEAEHPRYIKQQTKFYEIFDEYDKIAKTMHYYRNLGDPKAALELAEDNRPLIAAGKQMTSTKEQLRKIRANMRLIWSSPSLTSDEKLNRLNTLADKQNVIVKAAYKRASEKVAK